MNRKSQRNYELKNSYRKGVGPTLMHILRIRLAMALIATASLLSGCGNQSHSQSSNPKTDSDKPTKSVSTDHGQILREVRNIVAKQLNLDASAVDVDVPLSKQKVAADELDVVEIIMNIEETFGIEIQDEEVSLPEGQLRDDLSVRKLVDLVAQKKVER